MAYQIQVKKEDKDKAVKTKPVQVDLEGREAEVKPKKLYRIETCQFKRTKNAEWENGLLLNEGDLGILDEYGKLPTDVEDWRVNSEFVLNICHVFEHYLKLV